MENIEHTKETKATQEPIGRQAKSVLINGQTGRQRHINNLQPSVFCNQSTNQNACAPVLCVASILNHEGLQIRTTQVKPQ